MAGRPSHEIRQPEVAARFRLALGDRGRSDCGGRSRAFVSGLRETPVSDGFRADRIRSPADQFLPARDRNSLSLALMRQPQDDQRAYSTIFYLNVALSIAAILILFLVAPAAARVLHDQRVTLIIPILGIQLLFNSLCSVHIAAARRQFRYRRLVPVRAHFDRLLPWHRNPARIPRLLVLVAARGLHRRGAESDGRGTAAARMAPLAAIRLGCRQGFLRLCLLGRCRHGGHVDGHVGRRILPRLLSWHPRSRAVPAERPNRYLRARLPAGAPDSGSLRGILRDLRNRGKAGVCSSGASRY